MFDTKPNSEIYNLEAFRQLIRVLKSVQADDDLRKSFNLSSWFGDLNLMTRKRVRSAFAQATASNEDLAHVPHTCGTSACAAGYAGLDPWFRERGFKTESNNVTFKLSTEKNNCGLLVSWSAVEAMFLLDIDDASYRALRRIFSPDEYSYVSGGKYGEVSPNTVVRRIYSILPELREASA